MELFLETGRLRLRRLTAADHVALREILQDIEVMYAWEHAFSDAEIDDWIARSLARYERDGFGHFAVEDRAGGTLFGMAGPVMEDVTGAREPGVGWLFAKRHWGNGYAAEAARACVDWLFQNTESGRVIADIRPENAASRRVAERLGMRITEEFVKQYRGIAMPHLLYSVTRGEWHELL